MWKALRSHWPEYFIEGACLGCFMISACFFAVLLDHPASPVHRAIPDGLLRRMFGGIAMGITAIALIYSPWGKQSGAHMNPAVTLTFFRLRKIAKWDAFFYVLFQFAGGIAGVSIASVILGMALGDPAVSYAVTRPNGSLWSAFAAEMIISFLLMTMILIVTNTPRVARFTGIFAGFLVATYITVEAPLSGMSMNPARTLASAVPAQMFTALWLYFIAPPFGMLLAAELYVRKRGISKVVCAKLHHANSRRCIFCQFRDRWDLAVNMRAAAFRKNPL